jgi:diacylglycerol O-acyltransferase
VWAVDPDFDLSYHVRRAVLPSPGTMDLLLRFVEPIAMAPLDRARPLWEVTLVEGLEGGRAAVVTKMNHALTDGIGGQQMAEAIFDLERDPAPRAMPPIPAPEEVAPNDLVRRALVRAPFGAVSAATKAVRTAASAGSQLLRHPERTVGDTTRFAQSLGRIMASPPVEPSPVLRRRSLRRRLATLETSLDELKRAGKAAGGSVNDAFLAAVCGGVRRYHDHFGVPIDEMPMAIPISLRTADDPAAGNRWAGARLALPVGETDPAERIRRIRELVLTARDEPALNALNIMAPIAARLPTWLLTATMGRNVTIHDMQVSNVPGSPIDMYFAGAKIDRMYGFGPLPGPAAMIVMTTHAGVAGIGINLDPAAITEPDTFLECLEQGIDEVVALGRTTDGATDKEQP